MSGGDEVCSQHPCAPHGFNRNGSHSEDRYVCDCEGWRPDRTCAGLELLQRAETAEAALLAKSAAYDALVARVEAAPLEYITEDNEGCTVIWPPLHMKSGEVVRLLASDDHPSHTLREMGMDELNCLNRCRRLHPHCTLKIARSVAPDHFWHWIVTMPDGHAFDFKGGFDFDGALLSMRTEGVDSLKKADELWRTRDKRQTPETGASQ